MKKQLFLFVLLWLCLAQVLPAQAPPADYTMPMFPTMGYSGAKPQFRKCVNFFDIIGNKQPLLQNGHWQISNHITLALQNMGTPDPDTLDVLFFPEGTYDINQKVLISRSNTVIKGAGSNKTIFEWLGTGASNPFCFTVNGDDLEEGIGQSVSASTGGIAFWGSAYPGIVQPGSWVLMTRDDPPLNEPCTDNGAFIRQYSRITGLQNFFGGLLAYVDNPFRIQYNTTANNATIYGGTPTQNIGFECFRVDASRNDTSARSFENTNQGNIRIMRAVNCWIEGVESVKAAFNHFQIEFSSNIEVKGCYIRDGFSFDGGLGYGINLMNGTGECLVENNILHNLRHSIVVQRGANGNVISHNYSFDSEDRDLSDIVLHGGYPFHNLIEGNKTERIHVDTENCINGHGNIIYRNDITKKNIQVGRFYEDGALDIAVIANEADHCNSINVQNINSEWANFLPFWCSGRSNAGNLGTSIAYNVRPAFLPAISFPVYGPGKGPNPVHPAELRYNNSYLKTVGNDCGECAPPATLVATAYIEPCIQAGFTVVPGNITLNISGGTPPYSTSWSGAVFNTNTFSALYSGPTFWTATITDNAQQVFVLTGTTNPCNEGFFKSDGEGTGIPQEFKAMVYPNPFQGGTTLRINLPDAGQVQAEIYAMDGKKVREVNIDENFPAGETEIELPFAELPRGLYICKINYQDQTLMLRLTAQ